MTGAKKLVIGASGFLGSAMSMCGSGDVFDCVVDRRAWLRDSGRCFAPCRRPRHVLDAAVDADLRRFAFTSTTAPSAYPPGAQSFPEKRQRGKNK